MAITPEAFDEFALYESRHRGLLIVAKRNSSSDHGAASIMRINVVSWKDHNRGPLSSILEVDDTVYSIPESNQALREWYYAVSQESDMNQDLPLPEPKKSFVALLGFVRFLKGFYMVVITSATRVGHLAGSTVFTPRSTELIPLFQDVVENSGSFFSLLASSKSPRDVAEERYKGLFELVGLGKSFYYSRGYTLTKSTQRNMCCSPTNLKSCSIDSIFRWNQFLADPLLSCCETCKSKSCESTIETKVACNEDNVCSSTPDVDLISKGYLRRTEVEVVDAQGGSMPFDHGTTLRPTSLDASTDVLGTGNTADVTGKTADVTGTGNTADVSGTGSTSGVTGTGKTADVSGTGNTADISGTGSTSGVTGTGNTADVSGTGNTVEVSGTGYASDVSGTGNTAEVSGTVHGSPTNETSEHDSEQNIPLKEGQTKHHCYSLWLVDLIHGSFSQQRCSLFGKQFTITLIARRSRKFAGTRYLKRGVNNDGFVANDVEVEQIIETSISSTVPHLSSFCQVRGSIPTFWTQDTSVTVPKPPIKQYRVDATFTATRKHFANLIERYGAPIVALNLVKQHERTPKEGLVGKEYLDAVQYLNCGLPTSLKIEYYAIDFSRVSKKNWSLLLSAMDTVSDKVLPSIGHFVSSPNHHVRSSEKSAASLRQNSSSWDDGFGGSWEHQRGRLRSNYNESVASTKISVLLNPDSDEESTTSSISGLPEQSPVSQFRTDTQTRVKFDTVPYGPRKFSLVSPSINGETSPSFRFSRNLKDQEFINGETSPNFRSSRNLKGQESQDVVDSKVYVWSEFDSRFIAEPSGWVMQDDIQDGESDKYLKRVCQFSSTNHTELQLGAIRTNCIDCLDRTNVAQFLIGVKVLAKQLCSLGLIESPVLRSSSTIVTLFMQMFDIMGDRVSHQYAGSSAHKKGQKLHSKPSLAVRQKEILTSVQRYYSNSFTDRAKQDAINLFLGLFQPSSDEYSWVSNKQNASKRTDDALVNTSRHVWEMESDFYLHNQQVTQVTELDLPLSLQDYWWKQPLQNFHDSMRDFKQNSASHLKSTSMLTSFDDMLQGSFAKPLELVRPVNLEEDAPNGSAGSKTVGSYQSGGTTTQFLHDSESGVEQQLHTISLVPELALEQQQVNTKISESLRTVFGSSEQRELPLQRTERHREEYIAYLSKSVENTNNSWESRKLQAYAGATHVCLHGPLKGYRREDKLWPI